MGMQVMQVHSDGVYPRIVFVPKGGARQVSRRLQTPWK